MPIKALIPTDELLGRRSRGVSTPASICRVQQLQVCPRKIGFGEKSHITGLKIPIQLTALLFGGVLNTIPKTTRTGAMSNLTIFSTRWRNKPVQASIMQKMRHLTKRMRREQSSNVSYIDTGHLDDHVLKDIGLDRSDLTKME